MSLNPKLVAELTRLIPNDRTARVQLFQLLTASGDVSALQAQADANTAAIAALPDIGILTCPPLRNTDLQGANGTPVQIAEHPGGTVYLTGMFYRFTGTAMAGGGTSFIQNNSAGGSNLIGSSLPGGTEVCGAAAAAAAGEINRMPFYGNGFTAAQQFMAESRNLYFWNDTGAFTGGDGSTLLEFWLTYVRVE